MKKSIGEREAIYTKHQSSERQADDASKALHYLKIKIDKVEKEKHSEAKRWEAKVKAKDMDIAEVKSQVKKTLKEVKRLEQEKAQVAK